MFIDAIGSISKQRILSISTLATLVHDLDYSSGVWLKFSFSRGWIIAVPKLLGCWTLPMPWIQHQVCLQNRFREWMLTNIYMKSFSQMSDSCLLEQVVVFNLHGPQHWSPPVQNCRSIWTLNHEPFCCDSSCVSSTIVHSLEDGANITYANRILEFITLHGIRFQMVCPLLVWKCLTLTPMKARSERHALKWCLLTCSMLTLVLNIELNL